MPFHTIRAWVQQTRTMERQARARIGASLATETGQPPTRVDGTYSAILAQLQALGAPTSAPDRGIVRQILQLCSQWLEPSAVSPDPDDSSL